MLFRKCWACVGHLRESLIGDRETVRPPPAVGEALQLQAALANSTDWLPDRFGEQRIYRRSATSKGVDGRRAIDTRHSQTGTLAH